MGQQTQGQPGVAKVLATPLVKYRVILINIQKRLDKLVDKELDSELRENWPHRGLRVCPLLNKISLVLMTQLLIALQEAVFQ